MSTPWTRHALASLCALALGATVVAGVKPVAPVPEPGETIYLRGVLPSGALLRGERESGVPVVGVGAACVNCHRRSGLGAAEGRGFIPPITSQFLFHQRVGNMDDSDLPYVDGARLNREPFTEASLAEAIRHGVGADGKPLSVLMPHYVLNDTEMSALTGYLNELTKTHVPGVDADVLQFATIITPDADPVKAKATLSVLNDYFAEKNAAARAISPRMHSYHKMMFKVTRRWQLHVWELHGAAATWESQLRQRLTAEPVFAVLSGVGGKNWAPIHHFCQQAKLPCLFPNVELPVVAEDDFYSLYFSRGVLLEAGLIAQQLVDHQNSTIPRRIVQVYRDGDVGAAAAKALAEEVKRSKLAVSVRVLKSASKGAELKVALADVADGDELVLWLRPKDLSALAAHPPRAAQVWVSGLMSGQEQAPLPPAWRKVSRLAYPFDLPDKRRVRVDYPLGWFHIRKLPILDLQVQADTYLACGLLSETLNHMVDTFVPDYLVERIEAMLEHRIITGYYPRLALAPGQRFASKGGYIVHFSEPTGTKLVADGDWVVP